MRVLCQKPLSFCHSQSRSLTSGSDALFGHCVWLQILHTAALTPRPVRRLLGQHLHPTRTRNLLKEVRDPCQKTWDHATLQGSGQCPSGRQGDCSIRGPSRVGRAPCLPTYVGLKGLVASVASTPISSFSSHKINRCWGTKGSLSNVTREKEQKFWFCPDYSSVPRLPNTPRKAGQHLLAIPQ